MDHSVEDSQLSEDCKLSPHCYGKPTNSVKSVNYMNYFYDVFRIPIGNTIYTRTKRHHKKIY